MTKAAWFFLAIAICMTGRGVVLQWTINDLREEVEQGVSQEIRNDLAYTQSMVRALMDQQQETSAIASMIIRQQQEIIRSLKDESEPVFANGGI